MPRARAAVLAAALGLLGTTAHAQERVDRKRECARTSEDGQKQRSERHFLLARERFLACAQDYCPDVVRNDCLVWLEKLEASIPTVVFVVHDAKGDDVLDARVFVDGQPQATGTAVPLEPGVHAIRAELPDRTVVEKQIQAAETVRNRVIVLEGRSASAAPPAPAAPAAVDDGAESAPVPTRRIVGYSLIGASAVLVGVTAFLGLDGLARAHELRDTCKPACGADAVDRVRTQYRASYVTGALAGLALGAGLYFTLSARPTSSVALRAGASRADLVVRF